MHPLTLQGCDYRRPLYPSHSRPLSHSQAIRISSVVNTMGPNVAVVGGSLTGLAVANVLHRLGYSFTVFEKFTGPFSDRGSSLGFVDIPLWEYLTGRQMRRYNTQAHRSQGAYYYGDLWTYLYAGLPQVSSTFDHLQMSCSCSDVLAKVKARSWKVLLLS